MSVRLLMPVAIACVVSGCSGEVTPPTSPRAYGEGIFEGVVTRVLDGTPVPDAQLRAGVRETRTDAQGRFRFDDLLEVGIAPLVVTSPDYWPREMRLQLGAARVGIEIDLLPGRLPFNLPFYRQMVRDGLTGTGTLKPIRRWTIAPSFFFQTTHEPSGREVPREILDRIEAMFVNLVPALSGGRFRPAAFARGPEAPPSEQGWVVVRFQESVGGSSTLGTATVGGNTGRIRLRFNPDDPRLNPPDFASGCYAQSVQVAEHELFHVMGFWHSSLPYEGPVADPGCDGRDILETLRYHAAVAYSRPVGNQDVDRDPTGALLALTEGEGPVVSCAFDRPDHGPDVGFGSISSGGIALPALGRRSRRGR